MESPGRQSKRYQTQRDDPTCKSQETATIRANLKEARRMEKLMKKYGLPPAMLLMGPWPLEDVTGMKAAIAVLDCSLDPGVYEDNVQWDTFRKQMSTVKYLASSSWWFGKLDGCLQKKRMWISNVVSHQFWFS
jgi:hypothetical protein